MHNTKKYLHTFNSGLICANKAARQLLCSSLLFCFRELNRFLEISVRDPQKILQVSQNSKLDPRNLVLEPRKSKLEPQALKLDSRFPKSLRIENRVSSRDCQLTFERYCMYVYRTSMTWSAPYMTTGETASNAVAIVLFQKISTPPPCIEGTLHKTPPTLEFLFLENKINPPPIQNFSENYIHPHNPWKNAFWQENVLKWTLQTLKAV